MEEDEFYEKYKTYRNILSNKEKFADFIISFVGENWADEIEENSLEYINKSLISPDQIEKEADLIYSLKIKGKSVILYCLIELQSNVDQAMPMRLLYYMTLLWNEIIKNEQERVKSNKLFKLPVIIPMVLQNGCEQISVNRSFKDIFVNYEIFSEHMIDFKYILLNIEKEEMDVMLSGNKELIAERLISNCINSIDKIKIEGFDEGFNKSKEDIAILALMEGADISFVSKITKISVERVLELQGKL